MDGMEFTRLVGRAWILQGLRLTFNRQTGMTGLARLRSLCQLNHAISIDERDRVTVEAILISRDWGRDTNRTVSVRGLYQADDRWLGEIAKDVDHLALSGEHGAGGLMVKRQKSRDENVQAIVAGVLSQELVDEVADWGLSIEGRFALYGEIPCVEFYIMQGEERLFTARVDGWSGRMGIDDKFLSDNGLYCKPSQLQDLIRRTLEMRLDQLTAA